MDMRTLYRPVGLAELLLIEQSKMTRFPPRLPEQPIFYPVLNREYARQIARDWNTKNNADVADQVGFVTEFTMPPDYLSLFDERQVGGTIHWELWVPAEELERFNDEIIGCIRVVETYYGEDYPGGWLTIDDRICFQHNLAVFTTASVLRREKPILRVLHDDDGGWQFLPDVEDISREEPKVVGLGEMISFDTSLRPLLCLGLNQVAVRASIDSHWSLEADHRQRNEIFEIGEGCV